MNDPLTFPISLSNKGIYKVRYSLIGTAFIVRVSGTTYLVSAKHVFEGIRDEDMIELEFFEGWKKFPVKPIFSKNEKLDIIAFPWEYENNYESDDIGLGSHGIIYGQDLYFFGYPDGTVTLFNGPEKGHSLPFIKKGIISAIDPQCDEGTTIYIDGHVVRGLSGGPVLFYHYSDKKWSICGVIQSYLRAVKEEKDFEDIIDENSGIFAATSMEHVISMILDYQKSIPLGSN